MGIVFDVSPRHIAENIRDPRTSDFALYYRDARVGIDFGWPKMYDEAAFAEETRRIGTVTRDSPDVPSLSVPLLTWLVAPFALLPLSIAYALWIALIAGCLAATFLLLAPFRGHRRIVNAGLFALFAPVGLTLGLGQAVALVAVGLALAAALLRSDREWWAGLALGLALVKPQLVVMVPVCLLAARRYRTLAALVAVGVAILTAALAVVGPSALLSYAGRLLTASRHPAVWDVAADIAPISRIGIGWLQGLCVAAILVAAAFAAFVWRGDSNRVLAIGIVGSMLASPYLHYQDLVLLCCAGWLVLAGRRAAWQSRLGAIAYGQASLGISTVPLIEAGWLIVQLIPVKEFRRRNLE